MSNVEGMTNQRLGVTATHELIPTNHAGGSEVASGLPISAHETRKRRQKG